ncbi:MAG: hypothetical protein ACPG8W_18580 [Candidatus Promineifilaceae bacterium]
MIAIATTVAIAGATIYVGLIFLWVSGRFPPTSSGASSPFNTITSTTATALITLLAMAGLWRHSGSVPDAPKSLRATYTAGIGIILGWWLGLLMFGLTYFSG